MSYRDNREKNSDENNTVRRYRADSNNKKSACVSKILNAAKELVLFGLRRHFRH